MKEDPPPSNQPENLQRLNSTLVWGTICGLVSALGYTAANICLRSLTHCDPSWVSCVKAFPTVALISPWLIVLAVRGKKILPPPKVMLALVPAALFGHIAGNVAFQWSLGVIGIALSVPLLFGSMIVGGVLMGRTFLGEGVTGRTLVSTLVLVASFAALSLGAGEAHRWVAHAGGLAEQHSAWLLVAGIAAAMLAGLAYAALGVVIRYGVSGRTSLSSTLVTVSLVGMITLGTLSWASIGLDQMLATNRTDLGVMVLAGICNAVAFLALTKALQLTTVIYVNALNATQTTMAAMIGVLLFDEPLTRALSVGVVLTIVGLLLMKQKSKRGRPEILIDTTEQVETVSAIDKRPPKIGDGKVA